MSIKENYRRIQSEIPNAKIIAVTKYVDTEKVVEAYQAGLRDFGENRLQDAEKKMKELPEEINQNITWHFLGHLQTNKAKKVTGSFGYIHSVDSIKLAQILSESAQEKAISQKILIQVNISGEQTKFGFSADELKTSFEELINLKNIEIVGLMTMAPFAEDENVQRQTFKGLRELRNKLQTEYKINIPELSMGMSNDYRVAYSEGATIVRIGRALFC